jgi:hypothetical protein
VAAELASGFYSAIVLLGGRAGVAACVSARRGCGICELPTGAWRRFFFFSYFKDKVNAFISRPTDTPRPRLSAQLLPI